MKKLMASVFVVAAITGCSSSYDYYNGGVKYAQEGKDCVYYSNEQGNRFNDEVEKLGSDKKIVYRNTRCSALYAKDTSHLAPVQERKVLTVAATPAPAVAVEEVKPVESVATEKKIEEPKPTVQVQVIKSRPRVKKPAPKCKIAAPKPAPVAVVAPAVEAVAVEEAVAAKVVETKVAEVKPVVVTEEPKPAVVAPKTADNVPMAESVVIETPAIKAHVVRTPVSVAQPVCKTCRTESYIMKRRYLVVSENSL